MSSFSGKLGFLSLVASALAVPLAQPADTIDDTTVQPNAWWAPAAVVTPSGYPSGAYGGVVEAAAVTTTVRRTRWRHHHSSKADDASDDNEPTSTPVAPVETAPTVPSSVNVPEPVTTPKPAPAPSTSKRAAVPASKTTSAKPTSTGTKRGVPYNDASLTDCFGGSKVSWAYNWGSDSSGLDTSKFDYVPLLWGTREDFTSVWDANAKKALANGSKHLMGFNEPDHTEQANMSPQAAADAWKKYIEPYSGKAKLVSPSVTNGPAPMGLAWLESFLDACKDCSIDTVNVHWYDSYSNIAYFKQHLTEAHEKTGKKVWLTEFGTIDGNDEQISGFLKEVMAWMDEQDFIERYSYFMAKDGKLNTGKEMSVYGKTFASA